MLRKQKKYPDTLHIDTVGMENGLYPVSYTDITLVHGQKRTGCSKLISTGVNNVVRPIMNKLSTMLFQVVTVEQCCNNMLTILFIVGRTTLFTPVDINLEQVVDFLNFYACILYLWLAFGNWTQW